MVGQSYAICLLSWDILILLINPRQLETFLQRPPRLAPPTVGPYGFGWQYLPCQNRAQTSDPPPSLRLFPASVLRYG
jgi:hypothetical protein